MRELWDHQAPAADAAQAVLAAGGRATIVAAVGTGKTITAAAISRQLAPSGRVLAVIPQPGQLAQAAARWADWHDPAAGRLAVCTRTPTAAVTGAKTADTPADVARLLADRGQVTVLADAGGLPVIMAAHRDHGLPPWDLISVDDAHLTGRGLMWAAVHHDELIPAVRRLYLTATPVITDGTGENLAGIDNPAIFGPVAHRTSFAQAADLGLAADYRVAVVLVPHGQATQAAGSRRPGAAQTAASCIAVDAGDGTSTELLSRRGFGGLAVAGSLSTALPAMTAPRRVTGSHIRYWHACADTLYTRDRSVGGTVLLPLAVQQWRRARLAARDPGSGEMAGQLLVAAGELALYTGWIAMDGGQLHLARPLYEQARELAAGAGDTMLGVHVLANQSMLHAELARTGPSREPARQALRLAFQAQDEGRYLPVPRLHALIALQHASAASLLGDKAAFQAAITQARRELGRGPRDESPPEWLRFVDDAEITGVEARGWLNLGDYDKSAQLYRQVLASALSPRNRASYVAGLADALLKQGARHDAVTAALDVLSALEGGVTSMRCLNRLRLVRQAAANVAGADEFCARFDAIEEILAVPHVLPGGDFQAAQADVPSLSSRSA
jgi:hypothetical protein